MSSSTTIERVKLLWQKLEKCNFNPTQMEFLGYVVSLGYPTDPSTIKMVLDWDTQNSIFDVLLKYNVWNAYPRTFKHQENVCKLKNMASGITPTWALFLARIIPVVDGYEESRNTRHQDFKIEPGFVFGLA